MLNYKMKSITKLSLLLLFLIVFCFLNQTQAQAQSNKKYNPAGMDLRIKPGNKHHTVESQLHIHHVKNGYRHPFLAHIHPGDGRLLSLFSRKPFIIKSQGFSFKVRDAAWDRSTDALTGHGNVKSPSLPEGLYADRISLTKDGLKDVQGLKKSGQWHIVGFAFTPEKIDWQDGKIYAKGLLGIKIAHADVSLVVTSKKITIEKLNEPFECLVQGQTVNVTGLTLKNNNLYLSGYSSRFSPDESKPFKFNNLLLSKKGKVLTKLPRPQRPDLPANPYMKEKFKKKVEKKVKKKKTGFYEDFSDIISGFAGLPAEYLVRVSGSNMTLRVTSPNDGDDPTYHSGYINLPDPFTRANVYKALSSNKFADISNSTILWHKKKVKIPIIDCVLETRNPVVYKDGKLTSPLFGKFKILEISPLADKVFVDAARIDYTVQAMQMEDTPFAAKPGSIAPLFGTSDSKILFDVIQGRNWIGFKFDGVIPSVTFDAFNMPWFDGGLLTGPSLFFEHHSTGYLKFDIITGSAVTIPIIPDALNLVSPEVHFFRYPVINYTELWLKGNFQPPPPVVGGKIFKIIGTFYVDLYGMGSCGGVGDTDTGSHARFELFSSHVGDVSTDLDGRKKRYTCEGSIKFCGFHLFNNSFQISLKGSGFIKGSASIRITYYIPYYKPPFYKKKHKNIGIKYHISKGGHFSFGFGSYHFHKHKAGGDATFEGDFTADGIKYNGKLVLTPGKCITLSGKSKKTSATSGNDTVSYNFTISGSMDDSGTVDNGTIDAGNVTVSLNPGIPQSESPVDIDFSLTPSFTKDLQSGQWQTPTTKVPVSFSYTDKDGNSQSFSQQCDLKLNLSNSTLQLDLSLPAKFGGTYSQSFDLGS